MRSSSLEKMKGYHDSLKQFLETCVNDATYPHIKGHLNDAIQLLEWNGFKSVRKEFTRLKTTIDELKAPDSGEYLNMQNNNMDQLDSMLMFPDQLQDQCIQNDLPYKKAIIDLLLRHGFTPKVDGQFDVWQALTWEQFEQWLDGMVLGLTKMMEYHDVLKQFLQSMSEEKDTLKIKKLIPHVEDAQRLLISNGFEKPVQAAENNEYREENV